MANPILEITDGTTRIGLINRTGTGINLKEYTPSRPQFKGGGVFSESSLADGRHLQMRKWDNIIDVFTLAFSNSTQDDVIEDARRLTGLLEKAVYYWTTEWQNEPVWIVRRGSNELNTSYALIHSYTWQNDDNPFAPPFYVPSKKFAQDEIDVAIEHSPWLTHPPGESQCVRISNIMSGGGEQETANPVANNEDAYVAHEEYTTSQFLPTASADDAFVQHWNSTILLATTSLGIGRRGLGLYETGIRFRNVTIPNGATILSADVDVTINDIPWTAAGGVRIYGEQNAAPAIFSTYANFAARTKTAAFVDYDDITLSTDAELKTIVQEIVDLGGWASGNDLVLFVEDNGMTSWGSIYSVDTYPALCAKLNVTYISATGVIYAASANLAVGSGYDRRADFGVRFNNVAVPATAYITSARIEYEIASDSLPASDFSAQSILKGELALNPAVFGTYANFVGRTRTDAEVNWDMNRWLSGETVTSPDISEIISEIIKQAGWASGNDIVIFDEAVIDKNFTIQPAAFDHATANEAELIINYITSGAEVGRQPTCDDEVYIANKDNLAALTDIYWYDNSGAAWSASNLLDEATPISLLPSPLALNDFVMFGSTTGPFCSLVFDIATVANSGAAFTWEYSTGAGGWNALAVFDDKVNYDQFEVAGVGALVWVQDANWGAYTHNGVNAYWVRARVTTAAGNTPTQQNRLPYTVIKSSSDIAESEITGDITAIAKINTVTLDTSRGGAEKIIVGLRSNSRGDFVQHINTNGQNNTFISETPDVISANQANMDMPTGAGIRTTFVGSDADARRLYFDFDAPTTKAYYGRYRAFMRAIETTGTPALSDGDILSHLVVAMGASTSSRKVPNIDMGDDWWYFDYGIITIPPMILPEIYEGSVRIDVYAQNDNANAVNFEWVDLILVPADEYTLEIRQDADSIGTAGDITTVDSLSYMGKSPVFSVMRKEADYEIHDIPLVIAPGPVQLQANADQSLYFFAPLSSKYEWLGRVQLWKNERYITLRGNN